MMKIPYIRRQLFRCSLLFALCLSYPVAEQVKAQNLTADQLEQISAQLAAIQKVMTDQASTRNKSAADIFLAASQSDKAAVSLYLECYKKVNYDDQGREESDFRDWRDKQDDRFRDDAFIEGLRLQLRYLALSCKAAEAEKLSEVFSSLVSYVDSLTQLSEMPSNEAMQAVTGTVFARAYELNQQLSRNDSWQFVPYNIPGIYETTILPYLREENPDQLMAAWDKRIEQETRVVQFLEREKEKQQKGSRDDKREVRNRQSQRTQGNRGGANIMRSHSEEYFIKETLPALKWGKMIDMFKYGNSSMAAGDMLAFIKENYKSPRAQSWISQFSGLLANSTNRSQTPETNSLPPTVQPSSPVSNNGASGKETKVIGTIPPGLE